MSNLYNDQKAISVQNDIDFILFNHVITRFSHGKSHCYRFSDDIVRYFGGELTPALRMPPGLISLSVLVKSNSLTRVNVTGSLDPHIFFKELLSFLELCGITDANSKDVLNCISYKKDIGKYNICEC